MGEEIEVRDGYDDIRAIIDQRDSNPLADTLAEEYVLGGILFEGDMLGTSHLVNKVTGIVRPEMFYNQAHVLIYKAIVQLRNEMQQVSTLTVLSRLKKNQDERDAGGAYYLSHLTGMVYNTTGIEKKCLFIVEKWVGRSVVNLCKSISGAAQHPGNDVHDVLEKLITKAQRLISVFNLGGFQDTRQVTGRVLEMMEARMKGEIIGIPSGLDRVDEFTGGFEDTDLIILAARTSMGKTAKLLKIMIHNAKIGNPVAFFSLEMSKIQLMQRIISIETEIELQAIRKGTVTPEQLEEINRAIGFIDRWPMLIDDTSANTVKSMRATVESSPIKPKLIIVDQLNHIPPPRYTGTTNDQVGQNTRLLKGMMKDLNVPGIVAHQLSRDAAKEKRPPELTDLRDSGNVEQDADLVMFIHRPEYYGIPIMEDGSDSHGKADVIIAKQRNGPIGTATVGFKRSYTKFHNLDEWARVPKFKPVVKDFSEPAKDDDPHGLLNNN